MNLQPGSIMRYSLIAIVLFFNFSFAQQISITVHRLQDRKASLNYLRGEAVIFIDSITSSNEQFIFNLNNKHSGFYRLSFGNSLIDFLYDKENIELEADAGNISGSLKIIRSESNTIYYDFIRINKDYKTRSDLLRLMLTNYPVKDDYYKQTKEKLAQVEEEYLRFVNVTSQNNPNSFIARYIRSAQLPVVESDDPLKYLRSHSLDMVNFYDDELIYSDVFTNKTIEYLSYYQDPQLPMALLEQQFMPAVDSILSRARVNEEVYKQVVEYLLDGFKKFGFDNILKFIAENYVIRDDLCLDNTLGDALDRRIKQVKNFKPGTSVPDIILPDSSGAMIQLKKIEAEHILILFYASWCPHCRTIIPELYNRYKSQKEKKFEVLAVSIDSSRTDWLQFIKANNLNWINVSDLKGWEEQAALDYYIYATPTMFLIDKEKNLVSMPETLDAVKF